MSFCHFLAKISPHRQVFATFTKIFPHSMVSATFAKISPYSTLLSPSPLSFLPSPISPCFFSSLHTFISYFHTSCQQTAHQGQSRLPTKGSQGHPPRAARATHQGQPGPPTKGSQGHPPRAATLWALCFSLNKVQKKVSSESKGLISTDRGTKTTLVRTIPRSILSRIQRICPLQYLQLLLSPTTFVAFTQKSERAIV